LQCQSVYSFPINLMNSSPIIASTNKKPKMKFAAVAALLVAAMPTYAVSTDYTMTCHDDQFSGIYKGVLFGQKYRQLCVTILHCQTYTTPWPVVGNKELWTGECRGCRETANRLRTFTYFQQKKLKMKLAAATVLLAAVVPALATNFVMYCPADMYSGIYRDVLYLKHYRNICRDNLKCSSYETPAPNPANKNQYVGACRGCPPHGPRPDLGGCTIVGR
ncbi:hypothetical protein E4U55_004423, partial [Claviceps digitariae]